MPRRSRNTRATTASRRLTPSTRKIRRRHTTLTCNGKRRFRDRAEADQALKRISTDDSRDRSPIRSYECHRCKGWHLTSTTAW